MLGSCRRLVCNPCAKHKLRTANFVLRSNPKTLKAMAKGLCSSLDPPVGPRACCRMLRTT